MNPVFIFLVFLALVCIWAFLCFAFPKIGKFFSWFYNKVIENLNEDE